MAVQRPLKVLVNEVEYSQFVSITVTKSIETFAGTFKIKSTTSNSNDYPVFRSAPVKIEFEDTPIINGFIDNLNIEYSASSHNVTFDGRDRTCDIIDSTITNIELPKKFDLQFAIQKVIDQLGIKDMEIFDLTTGVDPFTGAGAPGNITTNKQSQTGFEFIQTYAKKRQVLLTTDGNGDVVLTRVENPPVNGEILNEKNNAQNNVLSSSAQYSDSKRFNKYEALSQFNPSAQPDTGTTASAGTNLNAIETDSQIRSTRQYIFTPNSSFDSKTLKDRTLWEANVRKSRAQAYTVKTVGFTSSVDELWFPGQQVKVKDEFASIEANMIISAVEFSFSIESGSITKLTMVPLDSFKLQIEEDKRKQQTSSVGTSNDQFNV